MNRRLRRAYCDWFGHRWSRWRPWQLEESGFVHERYCRRCPAIEVQRDGEQGVIHV